MKKQKFFDPGALNHRIALQSYVETSDGCGGVTVSWSPVSELWASLKPIRERVNLAAQQNEETLNHEIAIRYRADVKSGWRFQSGDRIFQIITVADPDERKRYLVCRTEEEGR